MKACLIERYASGELHVGQVAEPLPPGAGQVQIKMHGTSINPIDQLIVTGYGAPLFNPKSRFPVIPGRDGVGRVLKVGPGVHALEPGQRVLVAASPRSGGTYADVVNLPLASVAPAPDALPNALAAGIGYAGLSAWQSLAAAGISAATAAGQRIIINGASGGVGSIAVVLATAWGAQVTGTASPGNHPWLKQLGCCDVVDYHDAARMQQLDADIVLNFAAPKGRRDAAGNPLLAALHQRAGKRKTYVTTVTPLLEKVTAHGLLPGMGSGLSLLLKSRLSSALHGTRYHWVLFREDREKLQQLAALFARPGIACVVSGVRTIDELPAVFNAGEAGARAGKQVFMWEAG